MQHSRSTHFYSISIIVFLGLSLTLLISCRDQKKDEFSKAKEGFIEVKKSPYKPDYDSILSSLLDLQNRLTVQPSEKELMRKLVSVSYQKSSGCFLTAGRGVINRKLPEAVRETERQKAADLSAQRWAFYVKEWYRDNMIPFGTPVSGTISYSSVLFQRAANDTLEILVQIPLGSINTGYSD